MAKRKSAYQQQVDAKDGGSGGTAGGRARRAAFSTAAAGGAVCDEAGVLSEDGLEGALDPPPLGGGAVALFSRGRRGRRVPASLAELAFDDAEQLLDSAVNDSDARPAPPASSGVPVCPFRSADSATTLALSFLRTRTWLGRQLLNGWRQLRCSRMTCAGAVRRFAPTLGRSAALSCSARCLIRSRRGFRGRLLAACAFARAAAGVYEYGGRDFRVGGGSATSHRAGG